MDMATVIESGASTIRPLTVEELPLCVPYAKEFHAEMQLPGTLIPEVWMRNWTTFLTKYTAVILSLWKDHATNHERLIGGLGAMVVPDLNDDRLCGSEMFWFVTKDQRGGSGAIRLLKAYRAWCVEQGAVEARMIHLEDGITDEKLDGLYRKLGYRSIERGYVTSLVEDFSWQ